MKALCIYYHCFSLLEYRNMCQIRYPIVFHEIEHLVIWVFCKKIKVNEIDTTANTCTFKQPGIERRKNETSQT